jgi:hypothetical protein
MQKHALYLGLYIYESIVKTIQLFIISIYSKKIYTKNNYKLKRFNIKILQKN